MSLIKKTQWDWYAISKKRNNYNEKYNWFAGIHRQLDRILSLILAIVVAVKIKKSVWDLPY